ncbi:alpha/beta hydrolase fold protein [Thalassoporum mexicanum PCC 7367]|uniref:alpha/beta fold hydrolase n=1 Tax=Thalassoporum mexicanum TaxID=3457544 RepID=UPI00029F8837|nr:alpha/beta fold hydrolase [Pseudanabaena sp. PCC 7367]AFY70837.1 alpha/beta hydrolase fold protein [Pseudanabaena sp. PCC 7367]
MSAKTLNPRDPVPQISAKDLVSRDWLWRGWQTRYTFKRPAINAINTEVNNDRPDRPDRPLPILLIHGFGAAIGQWRYNIPVLSQKHAVYALDLVGFGGSEKPPTRYVTNLWVEQVYDFWRTFINQPMILVGNSIGSLVALIAASQHPEMAAGLVTISLPDVAVRTEMIPKPVRPIVQAMEKLFSAPVLLKPIFYFVRQPKVIKPWAGVAYGDPNVVDDELVDIIATPAQERKAAEAFCRIARGVMESDYAPNVARAIAGLQIPFLILWGTKDRMIPPQEGRRLVKFSTHAQLIELEGLGHCAHDEDPKTVNQEILNWIKNQYHNQA